MKRRTVIVMVIVMLLLTSGVQAQGSLNYRLDWLVPLSGGGGESISPHYTVNLTIGQVAIGSSSSPGYQACLGFWCGIDDHYLYLPRLVR